MIMAYLVFLAVAVIIAKASSRMLHVGCLAILQYNCYETFEPCSIDGLASIGVIIVGPAGKASFA